MTILLTGATGAIGSRVVANLLAAGTEVRALARSPENANLPGATVVKGDLNQPASLVRALEGVTSVFLVTPPRPDDVAMVERFLQAARNSPLKPRIVRLSAIKATEGGPSDSARNHGRADRAVLESGLPYAILRPNYFMQNFLRTAASVHSSGKLFNSMGEGRVGFIDTRDIADVAAAVLLDPKWDHRLFDLTGPSSVTFDEVARVLSAALGREVTCHSVTPEQARGVILERGGDAWFAGIMADYATAYAGGWGDFTTAFVEKITGRRARSIADFVAEVFVPSLQAQTSQ